MRILITGADGQLGMELVRALAPHGELIPSRLADLDVTNPACADKVAILRPQWVVHAAAATDVDGCEREPEQAMAVNAEGTRRVAEGCRRAGAGLLYLSTDYVFDGSKASPYAEWDHPAPLNVYGRSKLEGERATQNVAPHWTIVRTAWLYGIHGRNFVKTILAKVAAGEPLRVVKDQVGSPTYAGDVADAIALLLSQGRTGMYHVTNGGACSWYEFAREILRLAGFNQIAVTPITSAELDRPARRPAYSVLENAAWNAAGIPPLRPWREALAAMLSLLKTVDLSIGQSVDSSRARSESGDVWTS